MSFAQIHEVIDMPDLVEVQKKSYNDFIENGIREVLRDFSPITDYSGKVELFFEDYSLGYRDNNSQKRNYSEKECKDRDATFAVPLYVKVRLRNCETDTSVRSEVYMGDLPRMTPTGSFIINGAERVVVSQLVRSPGVYFDYKKDFKTGQAHYSAQNIPSRGAWLEFEEDSSGVLWVRVDRQKKVLATVLLSCLSAVTEGGFGTDEKMREIFHNDPMIDVTCARYSDKEDKHGIDEERALYDLNHKLRSGETPTIDSIKTYIYGMFFDRHKYDLSRVGRYKYNKKLALRYRVDGYRVAKDVIDEDGVVYARAENKETHTSADILTEELAIKIQNAGINEVAVLDEEGREFSIISNNHVDLAGYIDVDPKSIGINEMVYYPVLKELMNEAGGDRAKLADLCANNIDNLIVKHIVVEDVIATVNYIMGLHRGFGSCDNIDHLGNRRVRSVGELLQNQFRIGMSRLERVVRERMQMQSDSDLTPQTLINVRPVSSAIKEFFGSSQLSQFMDETNPIAELTHKRKLSALGPGGLNREHVTFEVRDVHYTHYSRMCPIETPEGQNIGLISSLTSYARINEYGYIEAPYRRVDKATHTVTDTVDYLPADEEDRYMIAQASEPLDENNHFLKSRVMMRYRDLIGEVSSDRIDYVDVSPRQMVSVATALIPFLENDDSHRALMASNMQRQAVPLLKTEAPIVGTGVEHKIAYDSGVMVIARESGTVDYVDAERIIVNEDGGDRQMYTLKKFVGSNQGTCINQRPIVAKGDRIYKGQVLADGHSTSNAELALGKNILVGFMSWEGYNYEDAILISERIAKDDVFTSIHINKHETEARDTKLGAEEITRDIPNVSPEALKNLDEDGIIRVGAEVDSGDILVGKVTPKGETDLTPEERLLRAIFGDKAREVRDTSLKVPHGEGGIVVDVKVFTRANRDEMKPGVNKLVRVYIAQKRKISVGDKMAGRHGNKGVVSRVLPEEDMPFMADGTPLQIVLNPLGVPSRMNIGQVLEVHLGLVAKALGWKVSTPVFDGAIESDIHKMLAENGYVSPDGEVDGKIQMYDGRTGEPFENRATVGYMYMLKLIHLVDDKMHARSTGPYSLVTQQPLGGKAQNGGQRFGEMEVWALYAYGAANVLQEIMTVKSDDVTGRSKTYDSIIRGLDISEPGVPESFKVLIKELQALALDVKVLTEDKEEIGIKELMDDEPVLYDTEPTQKHYDASAMFGVDDLEGDILGGLDDDEVDLDLDGDDDDDGVGRLFEEEVDLSGDDPFENADYDDADGSDD
ncbi:MAG: DNA-directed RNA polymerase subunit beta [Clostridiales bacterium]|nr:DNA-directed RNA polymerase subunit beta [Clostridiales bacterium]